MYILWSIIIYHVYHTLYSGDIKLYWFPFSFTSCSPLPVCVCVRCGKGPHTCSDPHTCNPSPHLSSAVYQTLVLYPLIITLLFLPLQPLWIVHSNLSVSWCFVPWTNLISLLHNITACLPAHLSACRPVILSTRLPASFIHAHIFVLLCQPPASLCPSAFACWHPYFYPPSLPESPLNKPSLIHSSSESGSCVLALPCWL